MLLRGRGLSLSLHRTVIMGILNVTPDSFSDGGRWLDPGAAVAHAAEMIEEGAEIVDVGGESTRPGADPVPLEEELGRVIPVIRRVAELGVPVSVDTRKIEVARRALEAGASILNDTLGEQSDGSIDRLAAETRTPMVVMHSRGTPQTMKSLVDYSDVVVEVAAYLEKRAARLEELGLPRDSIVVDPGIGFAKTPEQSLALVRRISEVAALGLPVAIGTSRKSFLGHVSGLPEDQRLEGTIATTVLAVAGGARIVRVHDVRPVVRAVRAAEAVLAGS